MTTTLTDFSFQKKLLEYLDEIKQRRNAILDEFQMAYLASVVPDDKLTPDWIINNIEFVEQWCEDKAECKWFFRFKEKGDA